MKEERSNEQKEEENAKHRTSDAERRMKRERRVISESECRRTNAQPAFAKATARQAPNMSIDHMNTGRQTTDRATLLLIIDERFQIPTATAL